MKVSSKKISKENSAVHFEDSYLATDLHLDCPSLSTSARKSETSLSTIFNTRISSRRKFNTPGPSFQRKKSRKMEGLVQELSSGDDLLGIMPPCLDPSGLFSRKRINESMFSPLDPHLFLDKRPSNKVSNPSEEDLKNFLEYRGNGLDEMWHPFCNLQKKSGEIEKEKSLSSMGISQESEVDWSLVSTPHRRELHRLMHYRICNHINPDIVVVIKDHEFFCHRIVLQSYSEFFDDFKNLDSPNQVDLSNMNVTHHSFIIIYTWMLTIGQGGFRLLTKENILEVLMACQSLKIKDFENQCFSFIDNEQLFNEESAYFLLRQASKLRQTSIVNLMIPRIQGFFMTLVSSKEYLELTFEELCTFLRSDFIIVHSELEVFMSAVRWLKYNWKDRCKYLMKVMKCVRFGLMTPLELIDIRNSPQCEFVDISQEEDIQKLIDEGLAIAVKTSLSSREEIKCYNTPEFQTPRNWFGKPKTYKSYQEFLEFLSEVRRRPKMMYKQYKGKEEKSKDNTISEEEIGSNTKCCDLCKTKEPSSRNENVNRITENSTKDQINKKNSKSLISNNTSFPLSPLSITSIKRDIRDENSSSALIEELMKRNREKYESQIKEALVTKDSEPDIMRSPSKSCKKLSLKESAATIIQSSFRGYITRKHLKETQNKLNKRCSSQQIPSKLENEKSQICEEFISIIDQQVTRDDKDSDNLPLSPPKSRLKSESSKPGSLFFLYQESILVFGGIDPSYNLSPCNTGSNIYRYHPDENVWEKVSSIPEPRYYHSVAQLRGRVYLAGGADPRKEELNINSVCKSVWSFDPVSRTWVAEPDMLAARKSFGLIAAHGYLYAIGGQDNNEKVLSSVERFDTGKREWTWVTPLSEARVGAAVCKHNHMIWVAGGVLSGGKQTITKLVECYDPKRNVWIPKPSLRFPRAFCGLLSIKGSLYIVGGASREGSSVAASTPTIDIWDERNKEWKLKTEMSIPRHGHAVSNIGSQLVIIGGSTTIYMRCLPSVEAWCVTRGTWIRGVAPLPLTLTGHCSITLPLGAQPT